MPVTQQKVLEAAAITLQDAAFARWTLPTLNSFLNAGQREIAIQKPNAVAKDVELALREGTRQTLLADQIALMRVHRNLVATDADPGGRRGPAITAVERSALDDFLPGWQDSSVVPYTDLVEHVLYDPADPRSFYVYPGNTGNGIIEARVAALPAELPDGADHDDAATFTAVISTPDIYEQALIDYVLYRAYAMDMNIVGGAQRATFHFQQFANSLGIKLRGELAANPDTTNATQQGV